MCDSHSTGGSKRLDWSPLDQWAVAILTVSQWESGSVPAYVGSSVRHLVCYRLHSYGKQESWRGFPGDVSPFTRGRLSSDWHASCPIRKPERGGKVEFEVTSEQSDTKMSCKVVPRHWRHLCVVKKIFFSDCSFIDLWTKRSVRNSAAWCAEIIKIIFNHLKCAARHRDSAKCSFWRRMYSFHICFDWYNSNLNVFKSKTFTGVL